MTVVYKCGIWDLLHAGHLNTIRISKNLGDFLVVGVATDEYTKEYKGHYPVVPFHDRMRLIEELRSVDAVTPYDATEDMRPIDLFGVDVYTIDEHEGVGDTPHAARQRRVLELLEERGVRIIVIPRTPGVSSTQIKEKISEDSR